MMLLLLLLFACTDLPEVERGGATFTLPADYQIQVDEPWRLQACNPEICLQFITDGRSDAFDVPARIRAETESDFSLKNSGCPTTSSPLREVEMAGAPVVLRELTFCAGSGPVANGYALILTPTHAVRIHAWHKGTDPSIPAAARDRVLSTLQIDRPDRDPVVRTLDPVFSTLAEARTVGTRPTRELDSGKYRGEPAPEPPEGSGLERVHYEAPLGKNVAYRTPDPGDGQKHPVVVWAKGGGGALGPWLWDPAEPQNDQSARAFREAGIPMVIPSWRGENDNPGEPEGFFGEVDDLLAARDYAASLPWTDPERVYLVGHSTGGTLVLLASELDSGFRAAISFGGQPYPEDGSILAYIPIDPADGDQMDLRRPALWAADIRSPTYWIEGQSAGIDTGLAMQRRAGEAPFRAYPLARADHFDLLAPLTGHLARRIAADDGSGSFTLTHEELQQAHDAFWGRSPEHPWGEKK